MVLLRARRQMGVRCGDVWSLRAMSKNLPARPAEIDYPLCDNERSVADTRPSSPSPEDEQELEDFAVPSNSNANSNSQQQQPQTPPSRTQSTSPFPAPAEGQIRPFRDYDEDEGEHEGVGERDILGQQQTMMNGESARARGWPCADDGKGV